MGSNMPLRAVLLVILTLAVFFDLRTKRIPNWVTLGGTAVVLAVGAASGGLKLLGEQLLGMVITGGVWLLLWRWRMMGGGDQKFMMAVGASLGKSLAWPVVFAVAIAGGLQALLFALRYPGPIRDRLKNRRIPYSIAIAAGAILIMILDTFDWVSRFPGS